MEALLIPYLTFNGNAGEAMEFYQSVLGGELLVQTFGDAFPETPDEMQDRIMHASLESDAINIMASDADPEHNAPIVMGNNVVLSLIGTDEEALTECFNMLAVDGKVEMPLETQFWGDKYGMVEDKFGVHWSVNISAAEEEPEETE